MRSPIQGLDRIEKTLAHQQAEGRSGPRSERIHTSSGNERTSGPRNSWTERRINEREVILEEPE